MFKSIDLECNIETLASLTRRSHPSTSTKMNRATCSKKSPLLSIERNGLTIIHLFGGSSHCVKDFVSVCTVESITWNQNDRHRAICRRGLQTLNSLDSNRYSLYSALFRWQSYNRTNGVKLSIWTQFHRWISSVITGCDIAIEWSVHLLDFQWPQWSLDYLFNVI